MRKVFLGLALMAILLVSSVVSADIIQGTGDWQSWTPAYLNENGLPYWDNGSYDGSQKNIGYYLTRTGSYYPSLSPYEHPGAVDYWGVDSGGFDTSFYFMKDSAYSSAALRLEIAGYKNSNVFGWYDVATGDLHPIFLGGDSPIVTTAFTPTKEYGFYLINEPGDLFLTQAGAGGSDDGKFQHFAVFLEEPNIYWIGVEDLLCGGDKDYNDMVIKVTPATAPVPEPATMLLLGSGLIGLAGLGRKKLRK
jgi:hypothetical protein